jgi:hypothetical protein
MQSRRFPAKFDQVSISIWRTLPFLDETFPLPLDAPFTSSQALAEGVRPNLLTELCRLGLLRRPVKGVYVVSQLGDSVELRARALRLVVPEDCVICDRHAGWLHGAEMVLAPNEHVELRPVSVFRPAGMGRLRNGLTDSGERNLRPNDVMEVHGLRVTTPLRTAWDLGRQRSRDRALSGLDAMLRLGDFGHAELLHGVPRFSGMRWVTVLRELAPLADGRAESPGESVLRLRWIDLSLPTPHPQIPVVVSGGRVLRLDVGNEAVRLGGEFQGWEWHSAPEQVERDKERLALCEQQEWVVVPVWRSDLWGPTADVERLLLGGLVEARRRFGARILHERRH